MIQRAITVVQNHLAVVQRDVTLIRITVALIQRTITVVQNHLAVVQRGVTLIRITVTVVQSHVAVKHFIVTAKKSEVNVGKSYDYTGKTKKKC
ncbi:MAG: hypothetical protein Q8N83_00520 [Ignavibacteria bacterium]|nr:hypothetical protein [Ignavibacteria bacterium]